MTRSLGCCYRFDFERCRSTTSHKGTDAAGRHDEQPCAAQVISGAQDEEAGVDVDYHGVVDIREAAGSAYWDA